jgi:aspartate kinase
MTLKVAKFGGTSMGSAEAILNVERIVCSNFHRKVIVVSAVSGITDHLIELSNLAVSNKKWKDFLGLFKKRHDDIIRELSLEIDLSGYYKDLEVFLKGISWIGELSGRSLAYILSFGERISSEIMTTVLRKKHKVDRVDSSNIIRTDNSFTFAVPIWDRTRESIDRILKPIINENAFVVVTGFIGSNLDGHYTTFSRGGSDYSAAILANMLDAEELEIWTDVNGIMEVDPKVIAESRTIAQMNYKEAAELSFFGAKILHPRTIEPAIKKQIPVRILNTFNPDNPGTLITSETTDNIKSVTYRKNVTVIHIYSSGMLEAKGFLAKVFSIFERHDISVDMVSTSEVSVSVTINGTPPDKLIDELKNHANIETSQNKAIVCLVGEGINTFEGVHSQLFGSLQEFKIDMISQGSSPRNISFVVDEIIVDKVVRCIYDKFFHKSSNILNK